MLRGGVNLARSGEVGQGSNPERGKTLAKPCVCVHLECGRQNEKNPTRIPSKLDALRQATEPPCAWSSPLQSGGQSGLTRVIPVKHSEQCRALSEDSMSLSYDFCEFRLKTWETTCPPSPTGLPRTPPHSPRTQQQLVGTRAPRTVLWRPKPTAMETIRTVLGPSQGSGLSQTLLLLPAPGPIRGPDLRHTHNLEDKRDAPAQRLPACSCEPRLYPRDFLTFLPPPGQG